MKRRKRENGAGTAFQLKGRDDWTAEVTLGYDEYGKRIYKRKSGFRTRMEALDYIPTMRQNRIEESFGKTVREVFDSACGRYDGSDKSLQLYRWSFDRTFDVIADVPVKDVQPMDWQRIIDLMKKQDLSHSSRAQALRVIRMINRQAVLEGIIPFDRSSSVSAGKMDRKVFHVALSPDEIRDHIRLADEGNEVAMLCCILFMTGMRINELLSLPRSAYKDGYIIGGSKTASGRNRIVPVASRCVPYIEYFASKRTASLIGLTYDTFKRRLDEFYTATQMPPHTAHDFRRTFATQMKLVDAPDADKMAIIGHANIEMTQYYQDSRAEELRLIVDKMW